MVCANPVGVCLASATFNSAYLIGGGGCLTPTTYVQKHHFLPSTTDTTMLATDAPVSVRGMFADHTAKVLASRKAALKQAARIASSAHGRRCRRQCDTHYDAPAMHSNPA